MNINIRTFSKYIIMDLEESGQTVDFGFLSIQEAKELLTEFQSAVETLQGLIDDSQRRL